MKKEQTPCDITNNYNIKTSWNTNSLLKIIFCIQFIYEHIRYSCQNCHKQQNIYRQQNSFEKKITIVCIKYNCI